MKPTWTARAAGLSKGNSCKAMMQPVEVLTHEGRQMKPVETDFISSVQRLSLEGLALALCKWEDRENKLELLTQFMNDEMVDMQSRLEIAIFLLPYFHAKHA